ncbi:DNA repair protein [Paxillus ammoniavirescens]|nr:DNA repair protein [Paxillus ammoniavirescens]
MAASAPFDPSLLEDPEIEELFENDILPFDQLDDVFNGGTSPKQGSSHKRKRSQSQNSENLVDLSEYTDTTKQQNASGGNEDIYGVSRFGHWGEYMRRKRAKLQIQNASLDFNERRSNIFKDISVYVNGWTRPSVQDLRKLLIQHGGIFQPYLDKKSLVTHIVTCSLTAAKLKEFKHMKVVRPEWLVDSVAAGVLLPWADYIFRPGDRVDQSQGSQIGQRRLFKPDQSAASTSAPRADPSSSEANDERVASGSNSGVKSSDGDPVPSNSQSSPRPLYMTDPATYEEAARIPGYAALGSNELAERVMADPKWRAAHTSIAPDFIEGYYKNSRLHHLSMWKAELKNLVMEAQERAEDGNPDSIRGGDNNTTIPSVQANPTDESSMRGAALIMTSPSKAKGKQKAEDVDRVIMHCDFDCFFVSAGLVSRPHLRGKPVVVCHSQGSQGGSSSTSEIASSSYEARAFGIKNGMSLRQARQLCPEVGTIPYEFERYKSLSLQFYTILMRHADDLQAVSVDEALVDVSSGVTRLRTATPLSADDPAVTLAQTIRAQVKQTTGCEVSIGIAENIQLARIATRRAKPAGLFYLKREDVQKVLEPLDIDDLHGFGHSTRQKAKEKLGVTNLGELAKRGKAQLCEALGKGTGETLHKAIRGIDDRKLESDKPRKSVSCDINYGIRFENNEQAEEFIYRMAEEVARRLDSVSTRGRSLTLKIMKRDPSAPKEAPKFMGHGICETFNKQTALANAQGFATSDSKDIREHALRLLKSWEFDPTELRGIGIQIQKLEKSGNADIGQAKLPFQCADRKPHPDGHVQPQDNSAPEIVVQPLSSQSDPALANVAAEKRTAHVELPSFSQVDKEVFAALPEDVRKELEEEYRRSYSPMPIEPVAAAVEPRQKLLVKGTNVKRITQQLAPKSRATISPKKNVLFAKRDRPLSSVRVSEVELRELDIDLEVFAALPVDMQREQLIAARHKKNGGVFTERKLVIKDVKRVGRPAHPKKPPPQACHPQAPTLKQQGKRKGEKLYFTETDDVQQVIEVWVEGFQEYPPNQRDVEYFSKFLVQSVESSDTGMEKTIAVMRWWLVLLRRRWEVYEEDEAQIHQATQRVTSEAIGKAWWGAFREVKAKVDVVARKRFGGTVVLR